MKRQMAVLSLGAVFLVCASALFAEERLVPGVYPTIQAGIDADANSLAKVNLSDPDSRLQAVRYIARESREAKAAAWTKAQQAGWRVRGEADGVTFELMAVERGRPIYNLTNNFNAAISTAANLIRNTAPYNLDGTGLTVGIWDAGAVLSTHQEFASRVSIMDGADSDWHSTHVGGTIGAVGVVPSALGMAPNVDIDSYDWNSASSEMTSRAASYPQEPDKIYLSNHSYGIATGWLTGDYSGNYGPHWFGTWGDREADGFGQYSSEAVTWDLICYSAPYYLPFKSAGNDRDEDAPSEGTTFYYYDGGSWQAKSYNSSTDPYDDGWDNGGFDTIPHRGNGKNIMTVGAVGDAVYMGQRSLSKATMTSFSGWGPTDDGRIKPDIVANGTDLYSSTDESDSSYDSFSGTSMSTADASGSAVLLAQYYCEMFPGDAMHASTLKGLIIHTADDLGNPGPDYSFGWGLMNTKAGADQIRDHNDYPSINKIVQGLLNHSNSSDTYTFTWNGDTTIRATLCWTDPPATALEDLDNPSPRLINDLDLRIIGPDGVTVYYPFVLDPANPASAATTGDNTLDNVEQVHISSLNTPGIYTVEVTHKATLTNDEQYYSVILSGQHHVPAPAGLVTLDEDTYSCTDLVQIELRDCHLVGSGSEDIVVSTDGLDSETVTLYEDIFREGVFTGTIPTAPGPVSPGDGTLQVAHGQIITSTYYDANDGTGNPATVEDTAIVDCEPPTIFNVQVSEITSSAATITFETDEPATSRLVYGLVCGGPNTTINTSTFATAHSFCLSALSPQTSYYFQITAWDGVGNETLDDNSGLCYQFTTAEAPSGLWVPADFPTIQQAIDAAFVGQTVFVADGTYTGDGNRDIDFNGKAITVRSENGPTNCIIDCHGSVAEPHRGFFFHSGEDPNSILYGFTITNGFAPTIDGYPRGGAIYCRDSNPTISNCILRNNEADKRWGEWGCGGAIWSYNCRPVISNCIIENNSAKYGGGIYGTPAITNCTFTGNVATWGGAIQCGGIHISNCIISNNRSYGYGGGIYCQGGSPVMTNCLIIDNTAYDPGMGGASGGGIEYESFNHSGTFVNCTIVGNWAESTGGGIRSVWEVKRVTNCIVRDNWPNQLSGNDFDVRHTNIQGGFSGEGNIDTDPLFISANDYHLTFGSPCVDTGTNDPVGGLPSTDIEGTPRPLDGDGDGNNVADMGAYEYLLNLPAIQAAPHDISFTAVHAQANPDHQIISIRNVGAETLTWQISEECPWLNVSPLHGESVGEIDQVVLSVDIGGLLSGDYSCVLTISAAGAVNSPQMIQVRLFIGEILLVPSEYGTIQAAIDAAEIADVVAVAPGTYTGQGNRDLDFGGKAITVRSTNPEDPAIVADTVINCEGVSWDPHRGFHFQNGETSSSVVAGLTITNGYDAVWGGGIYCYGSSPTIEKCTFSTNTASMGGGGVAIESCSPIVVNCIFTGNIGGWYGGGINNFDSSATVKNCVFSGNGASVGGGIVNFESSATTINCTFSGNYADQGGGIYNYDSSSSTVSNCILWGDIALDEPEIYGDCSVSYSDVQGGYPGEGNIHDEPCFVDANGGDYHLSQFAAGQQFDSPCVDAGSDTAANLGMDDCTTRTDGVSDEGIVDMGFHYGSCCLEPGQPADIDGDEDVDSVDYALFAADYYGNSMTVPRGTVVVDGNLGEWLDPNMEWLSLDKIYLGSPNDVNEAWFALQWDPCANKVYAAVIVHDSDHVFLDEYVSWNASDRIEVYSQGNAAGGSGWSGIYDVAQQYMVGPNTAGGSWATWGLGEAIEPNAGFEYAVSVSGDEIVYEVGVTQFDNYGGFSGGDTIVTDINVGNVVRFDLAVDTRWSGGFGMLSENLMSGKFNNADSIAMYMLVEEAGGPPCFERVADLDDNCVIDFSDLDVLVDNYLWGK